MATTKLDQLAIDFMKRIPDTFQTTFTAGSGVMPNGYVLNADEIVSYLNRAMLKLFNQQWQAAFALAKGKEARASQIFMSLMPELVKYTLSLVTDTAFNGLVVPITNPYLDLFKVVGGLTDTDKFIRVWDESKYLFAISGEYEEYVATEADPALIYAQNLVTIFPDTFTSFSFKLQYIALPLDPTTGTYFVQNGTYDSPFSEQWNEVIIDLAYGIYLEEASETV